MNTHTQEMELTRYGIAFLGWAWAAGILAPYSALADSGSGSGSPIGASVGAGSVMLGAVSGAIPYALITTGLDIGAAANKASSTPTRPTKLPVSDRTVTAGVAPEAALHLRKREVVP